MKKMFNFLDKIQKLNVNYMRLTEGMINFGIAYTSLTYSAFLIKFFKRYSSE